MLAVMRVPLMLSLQSEQRNVLNLLKDSYPNTLTIRQIADIKSMKESTVDNNVKKLLRNGFLRIGKESKRGIPPTGKVTGKKPRTPYLFEDLNSISNEEENFKFQFAPGSVHYNRDFLDMYDQITDGLDQNHIFALIVRFLEKAFINIDNSSSEKVRSMAPVRTEFTCSECGFNHEVRDFIRAMLLRSLDRLEIREYYIKFLKKIGNVSPVRYDVLRKLSLESVRKTVDRKVRDAMTLRVLSISEGREEGTNLFLGITQYSKLVCGSHRFQLATQSWN